MRRTSAEDYVHLLANGYAGEGLLAQALGVPNDDEEATRAEALDIGRWAHESAASMRG